MAPPATAIAPERRSFGQKSAAGTAAPAAPSALPLRRPLGQAPVQNSAPASHSRGQTSALGTGVAAAPSARLGLLASAWTAVSARAFAPPRRRYGQETVSAPGAAAVDARRAARATSPCQRPRPRPRRDRRPRARGTAIAGPIPGTSFAPGPAAAPAPNVRRRRPLLLAHRSWTTRTTQPGRLRSSSAHASRRRRWTLTSRAGRAGAQTVRRATLGSSRRPRRSSSPPRARMCSPQSRVPNRPAWPSAAVRSAGTRANRTAAAEASSSTSARCGKCRCRQRPRLLRSGRAPHSDRCMCTWTATSSHCPAARAARWGSRGSSSAAARGG